MKIIKPDVTSWLCPEDWRTLVARAARVCYGSETDYKCPHCLLFEYE